MGIEEATQGKLEGPNCQTFLLPHLQLLHLLQGQDLSCDLIEVVGSTQLPQFQLRLNVMNAKVHIINGIVQNGKLD